MTHKTFKNVKICKNREIKPLKGTYKIKTWKRVKQILIL